jgi:hypothetical protein
LKKNNAIGCRNSKKVYIRFAIEEIHRPTIALVLRTATAI